MKAIFKYGNNLEKEFNNVKIVNEFYNLNDERAVPSLFIYFEYDPETIQEVIQFFSVDKTQVNSIIVYNDENEEIYQTDYFVNSYRINRQLMEENKFIQVEFVGPKS